MLNWLQKILIISGIALLFVAVGVFSLTEKQIPASLGARDVHSPSDWVKPGQIKVYSDHVELAIPNVTWAAFTDTNSMDPLIDADAHALEIKPTQAENIQVGDVIAYQSSYGIIIHRIVDKGIDKQGFYYRVKGDNNRAIDPVVVRFNDVQGVLVAVIY